jgi:hypothetical protein
MDSNLMKNPRYLPIGLTAQAKPRLSRFQIWLLGFIAGHACMLLGIIWLEGRLP